MTSISPVIKGYEALFCELQTAITNRDDDRVWHVFRYVYENRDNHELAEQITALGHSVAKVYLSQMLDHVHRGLEPTFEGGTGIRTGILHEKLISYDSILSRMSRLTIQSSEEGKFARVVEVNSLQAMRLEPQPLYFSLSCNDKQQWRLTIKNRRVDLGYVAEYIKTKLEKSGGTLVKLTVVDDATRPEDLHAYSNLHGFLCVVVPHHLKSCNLKNIFPKLNENFHYEN